MKVAVDAMGGDNAPQSVIDGAFLAAKEGEVEIILVGEQKEIEKGLSKYNPASSIEIFHASQVIGMEDSPSVLKKKKDSSIVKVLRLIKEGRVEAVVSAGNSGATLAASLMVSKKLAGIDRPAIAALIPTLKGSSVLIDVGANVVCKPFNLVQFAIMGSAYAHYTLGKPRPRVGLLSNAEEESKGTELIRQAHNLLKRSSLGYIGHIEGRDIWKGIADVVVCDGFVGNVFLKTAEGVAEIITLMLKEEIKRGFLSQLGYLLLRKSFRNLKKRVDYSEYGGAPLLGIDIPVIISHGSSGAKAIKNAILMAKEFVRLKTIHYLSEDFKKNQDLQTVGRRPSLFRRIH